MRFEEFKPQEMEEQILQFWDKEKTLEKLRKKNKKGPKFYFLEGPPYTSGQLHLGHAWNMSLKDMVLRYKRMNGFNVWDRMGYDMHGLPTEQKVMAKFNLKTKEDIEQFGIEKFMKECELFCLEMMKIMNEDFKRLGATLDFSNPYQPIKNEFMEAEWWLIKTAHEKKRLYEGLRTMHWDAATQTAVAKHELEYKQITDTAIYVKFPLKNKENTYFIVWTTTPWTIPLNLAIMVNPDLDYLEVSVGKEHWILGKELLTTIMRKTHNEKFVVRKEYKGKELEGIEYNHPLEIKEFLPKDLQQNKRLFTILLSSEYVDATSGSGLVHCAPGCGPEDYEVGHFYHLPPFNCVNELGLFENFGPFTNLKAKLDDKKFIELIDEKGVLLAKEAYVHEYPHGERSHQPIIFRTTKQWFFKVEDLKEKMIKENEQVYWNPQAAKNAFRSWLENLRDNSITKQRYWGTPVPVWVAEDGDYIVVGSIKELEKLSKMKVKSLHIPHIDKITITKDKKIYRRIPDVLDVWIDAGSASWNCLNYPHEKKLFKALFPSDFILEGKDQIRGWFNLLMVASYLTFERTPFKNVVMHGFLNDVNGVKMSKSIGNIISPTEVTSKHGADVLRNYMSQTSAGEDINFSWDECAVKERQLQVLWNIHKFLISLSQENNFNPSKVNIKKIIQSCEIEEKYILSKLHRTISKVTTLLEEYKLNEIIAPLEELYLELSRTYIQAIREKSSTGSSKEKEMCIVTIYHVLFEALKMFSIIAPFNCEAMYLNLKEAFSLKEKSISHYTWPTSEQKLINLNLEESMDIAKNILQAALQAREKAKLGLRWPIKELIVATTNEKIVKAVQNLEDLLKKQINCKDVKVTDSFAQVKKKVKADYAKLGPVFGKLSPQIIAKLSSDSAQTILNHIEKQGAYIFKLDGKEIKITKDMLVIEEELPLHYVVGEAKELRVYLNKERSEELEIEGFARELMRNIQQIRKEAGMQKTDVISLHLQVPEQKIELVKWKETISEKVGAKEIKIETVPSTKKLERSEECTIKGVRFVVSFTKKL